MQSRRSFYILLAVTVLVVVAAVMSQRSTDEAPVSYGLHAPELGDRIDAVRVVEIETGADSLRLVRTHDDWLAENRGGYPANADRVRRLVLGLSRLRRLEKKTSDPERYAPLELRDIEEPGSKAVRFRLLDADGEALAAILVGKTQDFQAGGRSRYFVRHAADAQSWLVEGSLPPVLDETRNWLQQDLLAGVDEGDIRSLTVSHPDGETVTIRRSDPGQDDFELAGLAEGAELDSRSAVNAVADTFRGLSLEAIAEQAPGSDAATAATVEATLFNGVRIEATVREAEQDYRVRLWADFDPGRDTLAGDDGQESGQGGGVQLADRLNRRWQDHWFVVSRYSLDALLVKRPGLLKSDEAADNG